MRRVALVAMACVALACEPGLTPPPDVEPGFGGVVRFERGTWPPRDSLVNLWIFASQIYPLDSAKIFAGLFSNPPSIYIYPSFTDNISLYVDSVTYAFKVPPATYRYVGVLQRFKDEITPRALRVVGVYVDRPNSMQPGEVHVRPYEFLRNIDINVNFHKLPLQPF